MNSLLGTAGMLAAFAILLPVMLNRAPLFFNYNPIISYCLMAYVVIFGSQIFGGIGGPLNFIGNNLA